MSAGQQSTVFDNTFSKSVQKAIESVGGQSIWNMLPQAAKDNLVKREQTVAQQQREVAQTEARLKVGLSDLDHYVKYALTVDEFTPSLEELGTTRSRDIIATSKEYIEPTRQDYDKLRAGELSFEDAQAAKEELLKTLVRKQDAKRQRERRASGYKMKKQVERDVSKMVRKAYDSVSMSMEEFHDTVPVVYKDVAIIVPSKDEIEKAVIKQAQRCLDEVPGLDHIIHGNSFSMRIVGGGHFNSWLPFRCIVNSDGSFHRDCPTTCARQHNHSTDWWEWVCNEIEKRISRVVDSDNYEPADRSLRVDVISMYYYLQRIEDIGNWFADREVSRFMTFKDFKMFTANDLSVNCVQQVVEFFGEKWDPSKTLEQMLAPRKIIKGHPGHKLMNQVDFYADLVWDWHEDIATTDCHSIARIVEYDGHIGVVTEIRPQRPAKNTVKRLPYQIKESQSVLDIFVDIEAFESPQPGKYKQQIPYLVCWCAEDNEVGKVSGPGCVEKFVVKLLETYEDCELCLYAWYGSGYDYQHIFKHLKERCVDDNVYVRNNSIIYAKFEMPNNVIIHLKDPYLFILCSLSKAAKAFGVLNKGEFPHDAVKGFDDLDKVLGEWYVLRSTISEETMDKTILVTANSWHDVIDENNTSTVLEKAIEYCTVDVLAMRQVWQKFSVLTKEHLGVGVGKSVFTLSQLSMKIMQATLPYKISLHVPDREEYDFMCKAVYGGRVVARNGVYEEAILYADVVSLYPSAMKFLNHPYGEACRVTTINWNKLGIYEVVLTSKKMPENYMDFVPFRDEEGRLSYNWRSYWQAAYHTYDLLIAKDQGYEIECIRGMEWSKGKLFDTFVDKLFKMKAENEGAIRMVAKIALNGGGYGKFVQRPIDTDIYIVRKGVVHGAFERMETNSEGMVVKARNVINKPNFYPLDECWDKMVIEDPEALPRYPTQVGISILSGSRYRLYEACKRLPGMEVIYSDTDSIFVKKSSVDWERFKEVCGKELGQLDDTVGEVEHGVIDRMYVAGPKMYAYEYHDEHGLPKQVVHCKGIRNQDLKMKHFEWLCKDADYRIKYNMIVMAKRLVDVGTMHITKEVKQTVGFRAHSTET